MLIICWIIGGQNFKIPAIVSTQCKESTKTFTALHSHLHFYAATEFAMKPLNIANKMFFIIRTFLCQLFGFYFSGTVTIKSSFVIWCKFCKSSKSSKRLLRWRSLLLCVSPEAVKIGGTKLAFIARIVMLRILGLQGKKFLSVVIKDVLIQIDIVFYLSSCFVM